MENSDIKTDIFLKYNSSNKNDYSELPKLDSNLNNININSKLFSSNIFENSYYFSKSNLSTLSTFSDLTDTVKLNEKLIDIHNYLLDSDYVPQGLFNNKLNQMGGFNSSNFEDTNKESFDGEEDGLEIDEDLTTSSYADTSQIFPLNITDTQSSFNLPINFSETDTEIGRVVMDIKEVDSKKIKKSKSKKKAKAKTKAKPKGKAKSKGKAKK